MYIGGTKGVGMQTMDVWGKQVVLIKKTESQERKLQGMLEYNFDETHYVISSMFAYIRNLQKTSCFIKTYFVRHVKNIF